MSLADFVKRTDVAAKLRPLHSNLARRPKTDKGARKKIAPRAISGKRYRHATKKITAPDGQRILIKVEPRTKNYPLVGTAFDYLLRFELQRRAAHAIAAPWVAQYAVGVAEWGLDSKNPWRYVLRSWDDLKALKRGNWIISEGISPAGFRPRSPLPLLSQDLADCLEVKPGIVREVPIREGSPRMLRILCAASHFETGGRTWVRRSEIIRRIGIVLKNAKEAVDTHCQQPTPMRADILAAHAIRLAKLDLVMRTRDLVPDFEETDPDDIQDLINLLAVTPFTDLLHEKCLLLNPTFGEVARAVGGADADLIVGDMLVDIKTTKNDTIKTEYLNQLLGYFLLARKQRAIDPTLPIINRIGIYYSRFGHLHSFEASCWTDHPGFSKTEQWFSKRIERL